MSNDTPAILEIANKLMQHCGSGQHIAAIEELYADDARHVEAYDMDPSMPRITEGKEAILKSARWWEENHEVHGGDMKGPYPHGDDRFAVWMMIDVTPKVGPMANQRMKMEEVCLYTVANGKITQADFMWDPTGCDA